MKKALFILLLLVSTFSFSKNDYNLKGAVGLDVAFDYTYIGGESGVANLLGINWDLNIKIPFVPVFAYIDFTWFFNYKFRNSFYKTTSLWTNDNFSGRIGIGLDLSVAKGNNIFTFTSGLGITGGYIINALTERKNGYYYNVEDNGNRVKYNYNVLDGFDVDIKIPFQLGIHILKIFEIYAGFNIKLGYAGMLNTLSDGSYLESNFLFNIQVNAGIRFWF